MDRPSYCPTLVQIPQHVMFSLTWTGHSCVPQSQNSVLSSQTQLHGTCDPWALAMATLAQTMFARLVICSHAGQARALHDLPALAGIPALKTALWLLKLQGNPALKSLSLLCELHHSLCSVLIRTMTIITEHALQGGGEFYMRKYS